MSEEAKSDQDALGQQFAISRQRLIIEALERVDELKVANLVAEMNVSPETIRRDLRILEGEGRLKRVYGGAIALRGVDVRPYEERAAALRPEKEAIAACVAGLELGGKGKRIFLGGGSTTMPVASYFAQGEPASFMTNAIEIAALLNRSGRHEVELTGGKLHKNYELLTGEAVAASAARYRFDLAITSTNAIDLELGFLEYFESEASLHRVLSRHADTYLIVADHSKFGASADHVTFGHSAVNLVVTDQLPPAGFSEVFAAAGVELHWPDGSNS